MNALKGKVALVSGGSSGIGRAIAEKLHESGSRVAVADIQATAFAADSIQCFSCDVTQATDVNALYSNLSQTIGLPAILVCNAGRGIHEKLTEGDPEKWKSIFDLNVIGTLRLVRAFVPNMLAAGQGDIIFITSVAAGQAYEYGGIYAATKTALESIAATLRLEVLPTVRVTTVAPGVTDTNFFKNTVSGFQTAESIGFGALLPGDVADAVAYALSRPPEVVVNHLTIRPRKQAF